MSSTTTTMREKFSSAPQELDCAMMKVEGQRKRMHAISSEGLQLRDEAGAQAAHVSLLGIIYLVSLAPYDRITPQFSFYQHLYRTLSNITCCCCTVILRFLFLNYLLSGEQGVVATSHDDNQEPYPRPRMHYAAARARSLPRVMVSTRAVWSMKE
jgi:hypothetical protein